MAQPLPKLRLRMRRKKLLKLRMQRKKLPKLRLRIWRKPQRELCRSQKISL